MKRKIAVAQSTEELDQLRRTVLTRTETQAEADALFGRAPGERAKERKELEGLFVQTPIARGRPADIHKMAGIEEPSVAPALEDFFSKTASVTQAQALYPELLEVPGAMEKAAGQAGAVSRLKSAFTTNVYDKAVKHVRAHKEGYVAGTAGLGAGVVAGRLSKKDGK